MMTRTTLAEAKRDFARNLIDGFQLIASNIGEGWYLSIQDVNAQNWLITDARGKELRNFKTLEAAINAAKDIGFAINNLRWNG